MSHDAVQSQTRGNGRKIAIFVTATLLLMVLLVGVGLILLGKLYRFAEEEQRQELRHLYSRLGQIGKAFHVAHDQEKAFPANAIYSKDGKTPLLSWRVALLPYLYSGEYQPLYEKFKLDEPWDSEHNKSLIPLMPDTYALFTEMGKKDGLTRFQVFTGPGTVFDGPKRMKLSDMTTGDGTQNTLLVVLAAEPVIWTQPADLDLPPEGEKMPALRSLYFQRNVTAIVMGDASLLSIPSDLQPALLRALVTPRGGEQIDVEKIRY